MNNIQSYESFCINESYRYDEDWWTKRGLSRNYRDRLSRYNLPENPNLLQKTHYFFTKMEERIEKMAKEGDRLMKQKRSERGGGPNTGVELLFGLPAVVPYVLKRVFSPNYFDTTRQPQKDEDLIKPEFVRHTNEVFIKSDLPKLRTERDLESHIEGLYKKAGVRPRESRPLDELVRNRAYIWNLHQVDPNNRIFQS